MKIKINIKRFTAFLLVVFTFYIFSMHYKSVVDATNIENEKAKYEEMIAEQQNINKDLKEKQKNIESSEYYEDIARKDLGLLKPSETLYINADSK